ncbi:MAG: dienelactone hydrolase family protein [Pyrinomonadaceae bacterium]
MSFESRARVPRSLPLLLLVLALAPATASAAGKVSKETLESGGRKRAFYLYAPPSLKPAAALVVMLHGSGRNGLPLVEKWKELAEREGFVIAGPDAVESRGWREPEDGPDFIRDLVESLRRRFDINPRRVYLFGHSAGAVFALNLSMLESEYFAAAAVHAGSWRSEGEFSVIDLATRKVPLAIIVGDRDAFFPVNSVRATEAALKGRGFDIEVTVVKGHDHWYYDRAAEFNRDAWAFLKRHELGEDPKYKVYASAGGGGGGGGDNGGGASVGGVVSGASGGDAGVVVVDTSVDDFNAVAKEINALRLKADESVRRFYAKEEELRSKERAKEASAIPSIAREQLQLLEASAADYRASAQKAEAAGGRKLPGNYAQYFSIVARADARRAEALEALRERAQLLLGDEPPDARVMKMNAAVARAEKLRREADELEREAERVRSAQGP